MGLCGVVMAGGAGKGEIGQFCGEKYRKRGFPLARVAGGARGAAPGVESPAGR